LGVTNCLNFGNPYDPEVYYQFVHAIKGMGDACRQFDTPVTGGNVSFYNQSPEGPVYPTPTIGMVGLLDNVDAKMTMDFKQEGDVIYLIGQHRDDIASSEYLHKFHGVEFSPAPYFDLNEEFAIQQGVAGLIKDRLIQSAHDCSEGGLFVSLMESAFCRQLGFEIALPDHSRKDALLFGEAQGRVVVSVSAEKLEAFHRCMNASALPFSELGKVSAGKILIDRQDWGAIESWKESYSESIAKMMAGDTADQALSSI
jgi:phosphoribosylformylglycinamidine synthase